MIALLPLWRVMAWIVGCWTALKVRQGGSERRWPDKSAAVGVGGGSWNNRIISAVAQTSLLALQSISAMFSKHIEPSVAVELKHADQSR